MMDLFRECGEVNSLLTSGHENLARNRLIKLLDQCRQYEVNYSELLNNLIRQAGLYPYLTLDSSTWADRFVTEAFKSDVGEIEHAVLHREQANLLQRLFAGDDIAVSAPTSFGKSFIVDSFIATKKPRNVVIIVPTIALADETRRRLQRKFAIDYRIVTTPDAELSEKNILVFPQERALGYAATLDDIDILIVDEFYKASLQFDKERATPLLRAIMRLSKIAKQRYFLAPNISALNDSPFTKGMHFIRMDFNTVVLEEHHLYRDIKNAEQKAERFQQLLKGISGKSLVYAGTYSGIKKAGELARAVVTSTSKVQSDANAFADWLEVNYGKNWKLPSLVRSGIGVHNGQLHRSLSQIQIKLFEEPLGLSILISTSSIVEGVNTSAENVIIFSNKNGTSRLDYFTYRNIVGRSGRMFKHFVGKVYVLDEPPALEQTELDLGITDDLLPEIHEDEYVSSLTPDQISRMLTYRSEMSEMLGEQAFEEMQSYNAFLTNDVELLRKICGDIRRDPRFWAGIGYLNASDPQSWERILYKIIDLKRAGWGVSFAKLVDFVKVLSGNWRRTLPDLLSSLAKHKITAEEFFQLERIATYKMAALLNDVNVIHRRMIPAAPDISPFVAKLSHAFLPTVVYQLEEYGLPRMISKKIHFSGLIDLSDANLTLHEAITRFEQIGIVNVIRMVPGLDSFDKYIIRHFFDGVTVA